MTTEIIPEGSPPPVRDPKLTNLPASQNSVFFGPNGIRAGWRILISGTLFLTILYGVGAVPPVRHFLRSLQTTKNVTPVTLIAGEGLSVLALLLTLLVMAWIERRRFADYGLPLNQAFGKLLCLGLPFGFAALTLLIGIIATLHGYSADGLAISAHDALRYGLSYAIGFLLVGIMEELSFRGYLQSTLGSAIGFWPAALTLAVIFGALHLGNPGEAKLGAIGAACFALVMAYSLRRTGSLWFAIATHMAWDWGETFFYSVPDSGFQASGHLLNSTFHGPKWLTGGSIGPEGSLFVFPVLLLCALAIHFMFPARQAKS